MVNFRKKLEELHFKMSHIKCKNCQKVAYVPYIPFEDHKKLGIVAYTLYINAYLHYKYHWHTLKDATHSHVCSECYKGQDEYKVFNKELSDKGEKYKIE